MRYSLCGELRLRSKNLSLSIRFICYFFPRRCSNLTFHPLFQIHCLIYFYSYKFICQEKYWPNKINNNVGKQSLGNRISQICNVDQTYLKWFTFLFAKMFNDDDYDDDKTFFDIVYFFAKCLKIENEKKERFIINFTRTILE